MDVIHLILLSIIQGITEFLPISSSAHLLIPGILFGWPDQGLEYDIAVHLGTLIAVVTYFRRELTNLLFQTFLIANRVPEAESKVLLSNLIVATIPIGIAGFLFSDFVQDYLRNAWIISTASLVFGFILGVVWIRRSDAEREKITLGDALFIGCAQCLAIIPGVSRSGITITAGLYLGLKLASVVRFSFLLAIPTILGAVILGMIILFQGSTHISYSELIVSILISGFSGYFTIAAFFQIINSLGLMPFIIYRVVLSLVLMAWVLSS